MNDELRMSSKVGKRPLRSLSAHEKMDAIRRVHDGESKASVARDIGVPESTLRGWCKNEDKILYLSRQSTPETDDSEPRDKKPRFEPVITNGVHEPYNLSVKVDSPPSSTTTPIVDTTTKTTENNEAALNLITKDQQQSPTKSNGVTNGMSERERNRAELTRLSIELGLNRPEMFLPAQGSNTLSLTDGLMAQWNQAITQAVNATNKASSKLLRHSLPNTHQNLLTTTHSLHQSSKPPKPKKEHILDQTQQHQQQQSVDDSVWYWLKTQQAMLGLVSQQNTSQNPGVDPNSSWFWKWYKQFAYTPQAAAAAQDTTVLYQQLTKDTNSENQTKNGLDKPTKTSSTTKARAVLDNLLLNNNNNEEVPPLSVSRPETKKEKELDDEDPLSPSEALEHGEKFLKWLECFSDPSVTAMQVLQFRYLLNNVRSCADRKNPGGEQPKMKVRRK